MRATARGKGWKAIAIGLAAACLLAHPGISTAGIRIGGTGAGLPILKKLLKAHRPDSDVSEATTLNTGGWGALNALRDGVVDIAVSARAPAGDFATPAYRTIKFLNSPFVFVTSPDNPAGSVSRAEVEAIYAGTGRWPDGLLARVIIRPSLDIDTDLVKNISPAVSAAVESAAKRPGLYSAATDTVALAAVERIHGALSPTTLVLVKLTDYRVRILAYEGVAPSISTLRDGSYPLGKTLWITIRQPATPEVERFVAYLSTPPATRIICDSGALSLLHPCP